MSLFHMPGLSVISRRPCLQPNSVAVPYCQQAPKNAELIGVNHAQLDGVDPGLFGSPALGVFPFGQREFLVPFVQNYVH